jgi:pyrimidine operon attenuation protein/uracil phosphoribosyltransferase
MSIPLLDEQTSIKRSNRIDKLSYFSNKKKQGINKIRLVGFSGGATIAAIIAAKRNDITDLRTIAGNLDINVFTQIHKVSPLSGSLNPIDYAEQLSKIPQIHFVSINDYVITNQIIESYINELNKHNNRLSCYKVLEFKQATHAEGWAKIWSDNINLTQKCTSSVIH